MRNHVIDDAVTHQWQEVFDVVVVGSGAAGLVAAVLAADGGASVLLLEKSDQLGGTTALSGGAAWIPANSHFGELGGTDSEADALAYIRALCGDDAPDPALIDLFVDTAPQMLAYLEEHTPLEMAAIPGFPDYYLHLDDLPGRTAGGRAVEALPFSVRTELPEYADALPVRSTLNILGERTTHAQERADQDPEELAALVAQRTADDVRVKGVALVARLLRGLVDRGVVIRRSSQSTAWSSPTARWSASEVVVPASAFGARWCWPVAASSGTARWYVDSSDTTSCRSARPPTLATDCRWFWRRVPQWRTCGPTSVLPSLTTPHWTTEAGRLCRPGRQGYRSAPIRHR